MKKFNPHPFRKPIFLILYFGGLVAFVIFSFNFYSFRKSRQKVPQPVDQAKTVILPDNQTPQALISNFYSVFSKSPKSRDHLVAEYTTAKFQKKYYASGADKEKLFTCGGDFTQTFNLSEGFAAADNKMVYPVTLQYVPSNTQQSVNVQVADNNHKYLIDDILCPAADVHIIPKRTR